MKDHELTAAGQQKCAGLLQLICLPPTSTRSCIWRVDDKVGGLDVSVDDEDLDVVGGEVLWRHDDLVQVRLHQLCDHVDLLEEVEMRRLERMKYVWQSNQCKLLAYRRQFRELLV